MMARFKRLTDEEARTLTRGELLDRVEAEQKYWERKRARSDADRAAEREFSRILFTYVNPSEAIQATIDYIEGRRGHDFWDTPPGS
jgi:hypothetical protein